jgi:hypothetical protein
VAYASVLSATTLALQRAFFCMRLSLWLSKVFGMGHMRAICFALVMLSGLPVSSLATPLEDQAFTICPRRDPQLLRDCYINLLRTFKGHPRERARMDPRDAAVFCNRVAGEHDSRFCARFRSPSNNQWSTRLEAAGVALPPGGDPWKAVLISSSEATASASE